MGGCFSSILGVSIRSTSRPFQRAIAAVDPSSLTKLSLSLSPGVHGKGDEEPLSTTSGSELETSCHSGSAASSDFKDWTSSERSILEAITSRAAQRNEAEVTRIAKANLRKVPSKSSLKKGETRRTSSGGSGGGGEANGRPVLLSANSSSNAAEDDDDDAQRSASAGSAGPEGLGEGEGEGEGVGEVLGRDAAAPNGVGGQEVGAAKNPRQALIRNVSFHEEVLVIQYSR